MPLSHCSVFIAFVLRYCIYIQWVVWKLWVLPISTQVYVTRVREQDKPRIAKSWNMPSWACLQHVLWRRNPESLVVLFSHQSHFLIEKEIDVLKLKLLCVCPNRRQYLSKNFKGRKYQWSLLLKTAECKTVYIPVLHWSSLQNKFHDNAFHSQLRWNLTFNKHLHRVNIH